SQQGELPTSLVPRLRAVPSDPDPAASRFDSGAFPVTDAADTGPLLEPLPDGRASGGDEPPRGHQTADLLEAPRRRRGEPHPMAPEPGAQRASRHSTGAVKVIDIPLEGTGAPDDPPAPPRPSARDTGPAGRKHKGRASMPSWDEIVFGARGDDD